MVAWQHVVTDIVVGGMLFGLGVASGIGVSLRAASKMLKRHRKRFTATHWTH